MSENARARWLVAVWLTSGAGLPQAAVDAFRRNAGLPQPAGVTGGYGGWDDGFIAGHYGGHYLSAAARMVNPVNLQPVAVTLAPVCQVHHQRYAVYWKVHRNFPQDSEGTHTRKAIRHHPLPGARRCAGGRRLRHTLRATNEMRRSL